MQFIHTDTTSTSFHKPQTMYSDPVFNGKDIHLPTSQMQSVDADKDYKKPDREQYIFTNIGKGLTTLYSNNIITPIRTKFKSNVYHISTELAKITKSKEIPKGVFIIDYYNIYNDAFTDIESIIRYYTHCDNIEYTDEIVRDITSIITTKEYKIRPTMYQFRIITFVDEESINEHSYVYVPTSDIVIAKGEISNSITHPNSKTYKDSNAHLVKENKNIFIIEIIDNESINPYFIRIGNETHRIYPTKDHTQSNGGRVTAKRNGSLITATSCKLNELGAAVGIYRSKDEAEHEGSITKKLELFKLSLEFEKLRVDNAKIKSDYDSLLRKNEIEEMLHKQKLEIGELDIVKKRIEHEMIYRKAIMDVKLSVLKNGMDFNQTLLKHGIERTKFDLDYAVKVISVFNSLFKIIK